MMPVAVRVAMRPLGPWRKSFRWVQTAPAPKPVTSISRSGLAFKSR